MSHLQQLDCSSAETSSVLMEVLFEKKSVILWSHNNSMIVWSLNDSVVPQFCTPTISNIANPPQEKKERLIEEVRQIIGFQIDPKDERFKEALLKKEQEEKKAKKAAKKLKTQQRLIDRLRREADPTPASPPTSQDSDNKNQPDGEHSGISPGSPIV